MSGCTKLEAEAVSWPITVAGSNAKAAELTKKLEDLKSPHPTGLHNPKAAQQEVAKAGVGDEEPCPSKKAPIIIVDEFKDEYIAPQIPTDPFHRFQPTHFFVTKSESMKSAAQLANRVLVFLHTKVNSSITKIRVEKYWIKADVFPKSNLGMGLYSMCTQKIRFYVDGTRFVVDFTRLEGDALVYNAIFQQARNFVTGEGNDDILLPKLDLAPPDLPDEDEYQSQMVLDSVMEMAKMKTQPMLQAEAAAALAEMARLKANVLATLCTKDGYDAVENLLKASHVAVLYPLACLLAVFVKFPIVANHFANELSEKRSTWDAILNKVITADKMSQPLVGQEFAKVIFNGVALISKPDDARIFRERLIALAKDVMNSGIQHLLHEATGRL